jgi:A/G-specific adenine glycosylase
LKKLIIKGMDKRYFTNKLVKWYSENKRQLPWRLTDDPYKIWLSEVILQQTRVIQGLPYYLNFVKQYPDVKTLAAAPEQEVLRLWQGLGYYTRARNLHKCAQSIANQHNGRFPDNYEALLPLPGIGQYTAAAIASFAFQEAVAVVDGNVFRILSRIFGIYTAINSPVGRKEFNRLANELIPKQKPALHNQAMMDFGALCCTPRNPKCSDCPFKGNCFAFNHDLIDHLPVKLKGKKSRSRYFFYVVVEKNKELLMKKRGAKDIWNGLFDFMLIEKPGPVKAEKIVRDKQFLQLVDPTAPVSVSKKYRHMLTHQTIHCRFIRVRATESFPLLQDSGSFYSATEIALLPKPVLISRFLEDQKEL